MLPHRQIQMNRISDIRTGARVECRDGLLGSVQRIERDEDGTPLHLRVREEASSRVVIVPLGLVREVDDDGNVWLHTTIEEATGFTPGAARSIDPTQRIEPERAPAERTIPLHREDLVARVEPRELGALIVRTEVEEIPASLEVEAQREEIELEHIAVDEVVRAKVAPWYEDGELVIPVYQERLVVSKELVLKEKLRVRRIAVVERRTFNDTLRRERVVVDDPDQTGAAREKDGDRASDVIRGFLNRWFRRGGRAAGTDADEKRLA
jgi:uncharacterized protein (TIGR02271 family)